MEIQNSDGLANKLLNLLRNTITRSEELCLHLELSLHRLIQTHTQNDRKRCNLIELFDKTGWVPQQKVLASFMAVATLNARTQGGDIM